MAKARAKEEMTDRLRRQWRDLGHSLEETAYASFQARSARTGHARAAPADYFSDWAMILL